MDTKVLTTFVFRDIVYSLKDRELVWQQVESDVPTDECPRLIPLLIGKDRVYFARHTSNHGYDLVAFKLRTGERLYRTPLIAQIAAFDHGNLETDVLALIHLGGGNELIIQFDSERLISTGLRDSGSWCIINGADGQVIQKIDYGGLGRPTMVKSTSTSFTLVSEISLTPRRSDLVILQTFSRQAGGSFLRTLVRVVELSWVIVWYGKAIHPLTLQAFSAVTNHTVPSQVFSTSNSTPETPRALTLVPNRSPDVRRMIQEWWPHLVVDDYYEVTAARPLTLPPRERGSYLSAAPHSFFARVMLDERRIVFRYQSTTDGTYIYVLFDFTPEW
jgi:hypothetical protein